MNIRIENFHRNKKGDPAHRQYEMTIVVEKPHRWHRYVGNEAVYSTTVIESRYRLVIEAQGGKFIQFWINDPQLGSFSLVTQKWLTADVSVDGMQYSGIGAALRDAIRRLCIRVGG